MPTCSSQLGMGDTIPVKIYPGAVCSSPDLLTQAVDGTCTWHAQDWLVLFFLIFFFLGREYFPNMTQHPSQLCLIARADLKAEILFLEEELKAQVAWKTVQSPWGNDHG